MSEYLLAEAQPAISTPSTDTDDTARAKKMPVSRSAKTASGPNGTTTYTKNALTMTTKGASANSRRSARSGKMSSFWRNLPTSAMSCREP